MPSAGCSLPGCCVVISAEAAAAQSGQGLRGGVWDAMRWGCNSGPRGNREMGGGGGVGGGLTVRRSEAQNILAQKCLI